MNRGYLLDSHVVLWAASGAWRPRQDFKQAFESVPRYMSVISLAELCIKSAIGKLPLPVEIERAPAAGFRKLADRLDLTILPLDLDVAVALQSLPLHHRDPFDRLIIAQAFEMDLTVVTHDRAFAAYEGLEILWT